MGGPVTIGYGRYAPGQSLTETIDVGVMIVLEAAFGLDRLTYPHWRPAHA
ncbi:hypothetical protein [Rhizobium leguminosarum]